MSFGKTNYRNGGTRGGADQFKWDDVKNDKYRENYLGHSLHAPVGRWQKGKDLTWYSKLNKEDRATAIREELALAKQRDQDLMNQALGIAPKKRPQPTGQLEASEVKELLKRGASDRDGLDAERVEGLGAAPVAAEGYGTRPKKTLAEKYQENLAAGRDEEDIYAIHGSSREPEGGRDARDGDAERARKAAKKEKKEKKKAKKAMKKEKKRERRERHGDDGGRDRDDGASPRGWSRYSRSRSPARSRSRSASRSRSRSFSRTPPRRRHRSPSRSQSRDHGRNRKRSASPSRQGRRASSRSRSRSPPRRHRGRSRSRGRY